MAVVAEGGSCGRVIYTHTSGPFSSGHFWTGWNPSEIAFLLRSFILFASLAKAMVVVWRPSRRSWQRDWLFSLSGLLAGSKNVAAACYLRGMRTSPFFPFLDGAGGDKPAWNLK